MTRDAIDRWLAAGNETAMRALLEGTAGVWTIGECGKDFKGETVVIVERLDRPITEEKESL